MNKMDLVCEFRKKMAGTEAEIESTRKAEKYVKALFECMTEALEAGDDVVISGFGKFYVKKRAERKGVNPQTGEIITISEKNVVKFKPYYDLAGKVK